MDLNLAVAENIKRLRKGRKMSLEQAAEASGVSKSMLGQIERGEANPSVAILGKLAAAFKVPAAQLLENDAFESLLVSRELDHLPNRLAGGRVMVRASFPYDGTTRTETCFIDLYLGGVYEPQPSIPGCLCRLTVLAGKIKLDAEEQQFLLEERDGLRFAADRPYRMENMGNSVVRLLAAYQYIK